MAFNTIKDSKNTTKQKEDFFKSFFIEGMILTKSANLTKYDSEPTSIENH